MIYTFLFAGGPYHGEVHSTIDPLHWRVPVEGTSLAISGDVVVYSRQLIRLGDGVLPVMVLGGATDRAAADAVREALVVALGVTRFDWSGDAVPD